MSPLKRWDEAKKVNNSDNEPAPRAKLILPDKFTSGWAELGLGPSTGVLSEKSYCLGPQNPMQTSSIWHPTAAAAATSGTWIETANHATGKLFTHTTSNPFFSTFKAQRSLLSLRSSTWASEENVVIAWAHLLWKRTFTHAIIIFLGPFLDHSLPLFATQKKKMKKGPFLRRRQWWWWWGHQWRPVAHGFASTLRGVCNFNKSHLSIFGEIVWGSEKQKDLIVRQFVGKLNMMGKWQAMLEDEIEYILFWKWWNLTLHLISKYNKWFSTF